jgi:hypothetical protein
VRVTRETQRPARPRPHVGPLASQDPRAHTPVVGCMRACRPARPTTPSTERVPCARVGTGRGARQRRRPTARASRRGSRGPRASRQLWERGEEARTCCFGTVPTPCDRDIDPGTRPGRWLPATHRGRSCRPRRAPFLVPNQFCYGKTARAEHARRAFCRGPAPRATTASRLRVMLLSARCPPPVECPTPTVAWPRAAFLERASRNL